MGSHYSSSNKTSQFLFTHHPFTHLLPKLEMRIRRLSSETTNLILFLSLAPLLFPQGHGKDFNAAFGTSRPTSPPLPFPLTCSSQHHFHFNGYKPQLPLTEFSTLRNVNIKT